MTNLLLWLSYTSLLLLLWRLLLWRPRPVPGLNRSRPLLIGHRGVRQIRDENTVVAFRYAFEEGLDGIECDVQRSKDGALVLYHDFELQGRRIAELSRAEIHMLDPKIPDLTELLELARDYPGTLINLEIKSDQLRSDGVERDLVRAVRVSDLAERMIISSFNPLSLLRIRLYASELRVALLYAPDMPRLLRHGVLAPWLHVDAIHPHESQVTVELLSKARKQQLAVNTWTVNEPMRITSLTEQGVNAIMGDNPAILRQAAGKRQEVR